jgi:hypothetical protein
MYKLIAVENRLRYPSGRFADHPSEDETNELLEELKRLRRLDQETRHCWCKHCRELRYRASRAQDPPAQPPLIRVP